MAKLVETVPFNYEELRKEIDKKFKNAGYDTSLGSNVSQLSNILTYTVSSLNVNTALNVNELILPYSTRRENIVEIARQFSYEHTKEKSYVYNLTLRLKNGQHIIPKYTEFKGNGNTYVLISEEINANVTEEYRDIPVVVKEGERITYNDDPQSLIHTIGEITENGQTQTQYYINIPYAGVEENGIEVFCSYYDEYGLYHDKIKFQERKSTFIENDGKFKQQYIRLDNPEYFTPRIYFKYSGSGGGLAKGSEVYINVLITSGDKGSLGKIQPSEIKCDIPGVEVIKYEIESAGQQAESSESIKRNAPMIYNSSNRTVVSDDYRGACNRDTRIHDSVIWGGEKEFPKAPGHIWFSFAPSLVAKGFDSDKLKSYFERQDTELKWNYTLQKEDEDRNKNRADAYYRANYLPAQTIQSASFDKYGELMNPGIWDNIKSYAIPTLVYHHRHPIFCEFFYEIDVLKYSMYDNQPLIRQEIFDIINNAFKGKDSVQYESFDAEYFDASIIKRVDKRITDISGFKYDTKTRLVLNRRTLAIENQNPNYRDIYIPLKCPFERYFDNDGYLLSDLLPSIDTEDFIKYMDIKGRTKSSIYVDWSFLKEERENSTIQETQKLIIAPVKTLQAFRYEVKDQHANKNIQLPFRVYPDQYGSNDKAFTYKNTKVTVTTDGIKNEIQNGSTGWSNTELDRSIITLGSSVTLNSSSIVEVEYHGHCGYYYLFNSYIKEIIVHLFVDGTVDGFTDESKVAAIVGITEGGNDGSNGLDSDLAPAAASASLQAGIPVSHEDYNECLGDECENVQDDFYLRHEADLEDNIHYSEAMKYTPKSYATFEQTRYSTSPYAYNNYLSKVEKEPPFYIPTPGKMGSTPQSYLYSIDSKYAYTLDSYYLTTNGFVQTKDTEESMYAGPVVKYINDNMYLRSSLKADLFLMNRYLNLKYNSPNFQVIRNVIPMLRKVHFKTFGQQVNE